MNVLIPLVVGVAILVVGARMYAYYVSRKLGVDDSNPTPAHRHQDGRDYVPTRTHVVFAHHFSVIAGAGPIVGPTLALAYGWGPPWLWIVCGCVLFGAVHDMCAMFVSMREDGKSIADMCRRTLGGTGYILFVAFLILMLTLVNAVFLNLSVKALLASYPADLLKLAPNDTLLNQFTENGVRMGRIGGIATTSVVIITLFAPILGWMIYKKRFPTAPLYVLATVVCILSVVIGFQYPIFFRQAIGGLMPDDVWRFCMSLYIFFACWLPVWIILQPRDFINVQILYAGVLMMLLGIVLYGLKGFSIPANLMFAGDIKVDPMWPFLFITVACGAISGFHSLAATGTTVKQISKESEVRRVGYNCMILEGALALLALLMVVAALPRNEFINIVYPGKDGNPILAFSIAMGYMLNQITGMKIALGCVLGILVLEGFVITTLDTAVRLCRYMLEEFWNFIMKGRQSPMFKNPFFNTLVAVAMMLFFAKNSTILSLWPIFGAGNQLIAALAMTVVAVWLLARSRSIWFAVVPAVLMVVTTFTTLILKLRSNLAPAGSGRLIVENQGPLVGVVCFLLLLATGVLIVAVRRFAQLRRERSEVSA
jgi:carbon starvation protein